MHNEKHKDNKDTKEKEYKDLGAQGDTKSRAQTHKRAWRAQTHKRAKIQKRLDGHHNSPHFLQQ